MVGLLEGHTVSHIVIVGFHGVVIGIVGVQDTSYQERKKKY